MAGLGTSPVSTVRLLPHTRVRLGNGREQGAGIRVLGIAAEGAAVRDFHDATEVHDRDAVGDMLDDAQVVRDEEEGKAEPALKVLKKIDDLGLNRHVQGRNGFVCNDEIGIHGQRP